MVSERIKQPVSYVNYQFPMDWYMGALCNEHYPRGLEELYRLYLDHLFG